MYDEVCLMVKVIDIYNDVDIRTNCRERCEEDMCVIHNLGSCKIEA